jgi:hypothetical protein
MELQQTNIFDKGALIFFSTPSWGAKKQIKKKVYIDNTNPDWISSQKDLIDREIIKQIGNTMNKARSYVSTLSLPFPVIGRSKRTNRMQRVIMRSTYFVPYEMIPEIEKNLQKFQDDVFELVAQISDPNTYEKLKQEAKEELGDNWREGDYPENLQSRFDFMWSFFEIAAPDSKTLKKINPKMYEEEKLRWQQQMNEAREFMITSLREEFLELVKHMSEMLSNPQHVLHKNLLPNFLEMTNVIKNKNCFDDEELKRIIELAEGIATKTNIDLLKDSELLRDNVAKQFEIIKEKVEQGVVKRTRRLVLGGVRAVGGN